MEVQDRRAVVYFSYAAQDEDELNISPGQVHIAYTVAEELALIVTYCHCFCRLSMCLAREKKDGGRES